MRFSSFHFPISSLGAALLVSGCISVGPDYKEPDLPVPDAWETGLSRDLRGGASGIAGWWRNFNDSRLTRVIERVGESNPDLRLAAERIVEARARRGVAQSQLFPSAAATGDYARSRTSENLLDPPPEANPSNFYRAGFDAGWELDVFGGIRRLVESEDARIGASVETYRDVLVTLYAEAALNYIEYRTLERRIELASKNIKSQEDSLVLAQGRFDAGLASDLDVSQAETEVATSKALLPLLAEQKAYARNRLAALTGGFPGVLDSVLGGGGGSIPQPRKGFAAGLPVDLIRSRPDIRRAERELAAQTALIGVATAELYPRFVLAGNFALEAVDSGDLFDSASRAYGFGPSFRWEVFSAGRIRNMIRVEESLSRQAFANYEGTVIRGVEEVESAMAGIAHERDRKEQLDKAVGLSEKTVTLVKQNYTQGLVDFQDVIDGQRTLFSNDDNAAISDGQVAKDYVILYKALGGGTAVDLPVQAGPESRTGGEAANAGATP